MNELFKALPALLRQMPDNPEVKQAVIFAAWRRAAGRELAERTSAISLNAGTLSIAVADRNWQRQLKSLSPELLYKINALLETGEVVYLEFVIDPVRAAKGKRAGELEPEIVSPHPGDDIEKAAAAIRDETLRNNFLQAAAATLERKKRYGR